MSKFPFAHPSEEVAYFVLYEDLKEREDDDEDDESSTDARYEEMRAAYETVRHYRHNSNVECVFKHVPTGRLFEFNAYYDSWNGTDLDGDGGMFEVEAFTHTVTNYRAVEK